MTEQGGLEPLASWLRDGLASADVASLLQTPLEGGSEVGKLEDARLLRILVERLEARASAAIRLAGSGEAATEEGASLPEAVRSVDASLPARLGRPVDGVALETVSEPATLLLVLQGGRPMQRRAALERLAELLDTEGRKAHGAEWKRAIETVEALQDPALAWARQRVLLRAGGGRERRVRVEAERRARAFQVALRRARRWWEGEREPEPVTALPGDERARLLLWLREAPDALAAHVAALIEGGEPSLRSEERLALLSSCRYTGDPRLTASLITVLRVERGALVSEAGRALANIRDPRVLPALRKAFAREVLEATRVALAGALGELGDMRGLGLVRGLLEEGEDPARAQSALAALESLGEPEDAERVVPWLGAEDPSIRLQAVRTLGRIGDARAMEPLLAALAEPDLPVGLRRAAEEALDAVRARMELRGEESVSLPLLGERPSMLPPSVGSEAEAAVGWRRRLSARWMYWMGRLWAALGARERALQLFEEGARRRPRWVFPRLAAARLQTRMGRYGAALASFRLALEADRRTVEASSTTMEALVLAFLRRAEQMERDGRREVARGLIDEVRTLDLRRVPGSLRFEVERRAEDLRLWLAEETARGSTRTEAP